MPFNINELSSSISKYGVQRTSHYTANITLPSILGDKGIMTESPIRVNSVNLPGINLASDEIKYKGFGLTEKRAIQSNYDDIAITMIADHSGRLSDAMYSWFELIHPADIEKHNSMDIEYMEYPNNYYGGLEINLYDSTGTMHTTFNFIHPFPTAIGSVQMSWEDQNTIMLLPVSFAYRSYTRKSHINAD